MPFGIFLFSLKSEFQEKPHFARKVPKNGEKRRKPEKISGFLFGIFFVNTCWRRHPPFALRAKICTLAACEQAPRRLRGKTEPVSLRVAQENAIRRAYSAPKRKKSTQAGALFAFGGATRIRTGDEGFADPCLTTWPWRHIQNALLL